MLFNLLLANITILLWFFLLFLVVFKTFFTNPAVIENARTQFALIIPTGAPITVVKDAIEMLRVGTDKILKRNNIFTKIFANYFSFFNLRNKIIVNFIDFV